ncbi:MAG: hypothetical protein KBG80_09740 [Breznakibacter sp.]|nr:hypothetical protein [Breznakibacter sp.]
MILVKEFMNNLVLRLTYSIFFGFLFSINLLAFTKDENVYSLEKDTLELLFREFVPDNYEIRDVAKGFINRDTLTDYAIIIRDSLDWESNRLIVLFQHENKSFVKSIETDNVISIRWENHISVTNNVINIHSYIPIDGMIEKEYSIEYISNNWYCFYISLRGGNPKNYWENSFDLKTGEFSIKHTIYLQNEEVQIREIQGKSEDVLPISITTEDIDKYLKIVNHGNTYYLNYECNLWTNEEIKRLNDDR